MYQVKYFAILLIALCVLPAGCDAEGVRTYRFAVPRDAAVEISGSGEVLTLVCRFQAGRGLPEAENRQADRRNAAILARKALAKYFALPADRELLISGLEPEEALRRGDVVQFRFRINRSNCRIERQLNPTEDIKNGQ